MRKKTTTLNPRNLIFAKSQITFLRNKFSSFVLFDTILRSIIAYMGPYESQGNHFKYTIIISLVCSPLIYYCTIGLTILKLLGTKLDGWNWFTYCFLVAANYGTKFFGVGDHFLWDWYFPVVSTLYCEQ